ncbi:MAG: class I SAM-dependent methyltransferase, partial [Acidimicrobiales bacterium]
MAGPSEAPATIVVRAPAALRRLMWAPGELGLARAYVSGDLELEGDLHALLALRDRLAADGPPSRRRWAALGTLALLAARLGALNPPPPPPAEEARLAGARHSKRRDAAAIAYHYDATDQFYRLFLGRTMTYSCGYFEAPDSTLD